MRQSGGMPLCPSITPKIPAIPNCYAVNRSPSEGVGPTDRNATRRQAYGREGLRRSPEASSICPRVLRAGNAPTLARLWSRICLL